MDGLARRYRAQQATVGVVAVDPTSPYTGGAILGDRIRMREHDSDPGFYMRSMATRGSLGGLARASADVAAVIEASGKDRILLETVGVGQDEIDIVRLADITIVVLVPGMGDDVQSIKAGIMEIADIFVVNKSDREGADRVEKEVRSMQSLAAHHGDWIPPIVRTIASTGAGIEELEQAVEHFWSWLAQEGRLTARREAHWRTRLMEMVSHELLRDHARTWPERPVTGRDQPPGRAETAGPIPACPTLGRTIIAARRERWQGLTTWALRSGASRKPGACMRPWV